MHVQLTAAENLDNGIYYRYFRNFSLRLFWLHHQSRLSFEFLWDDRMIQEPQSSFLWICFLMLRSGLCEVVQYKYPMNYLMTIFYVYFKCNSIQVWDRDCVRWCEMSTPWATYCLAPLPPVRVGRAPFSITTPFLP